MMRIKFGNLWDDPEMTMDDDIWGITVYKDEDENKREKILITNKDDERVYVRLEKRDFPREYGYDIYVKTRFQIQPMEIIKFVKKYEINIKRVDVLRYSFFSNEDRVFVLEELLDMIGNGRL